MTQRKASFTSDQWAAIVALSGLSATQPGKRGDVATSDGEYLRAAIGALATLAKRSDVAALFSQTRTRGGDRVSAAKKQKGRP